MARFGYCTFAYGFEHYELFLGAIAGLSAIATTAIIGRILADKKPSEEIWITPSGFEKYILASIRDHENNLSKKQKELACLQKEIANEQKQIEELRVSLKRIRSFKTAEESINGGKNNG